MFKINYINKNFILSTIIKKITNMKYIYFIYLKKLLRTVTFFTYTSMRWEYIHGLFMGEIYWS